MSGACSMMEAMKNTRRILVRKPQGKKPIVRLKRRWEANIKMDLKEIVCVYILAWMYLVQSFYEHDNEPSGSLQSWEFID